MTLGPGGYAVPPDATVRNIDLDARCSRTEANA